ncbi:MAG: DUF5658 family protein [Syntrophobacteraceae bacterium]
METSCYPERRSGIDRRARPTSPFTWRSLTGSRAYARRKADRDVHYYVDRYGFPAVFAFCVTLLFSIGDAFFTMKLVSAGAKELNPVMDYFLQFGPVPFVAVKYVLTASGLTWLLIHKDYPMFKGRITGKVLFLFVPIIYMVLLVYEMVLVFVIIP